MLILGNKVFLSKNIVTISNYYSEALIKVKILKFIRSIINKHLLFLLGLEIVYLIPVIIPGWNL